MDIIIREVIAATCRIDRFLIKAFISISMNPDPSSVNMFGTIVGG